VLCSAEPSAASTEESLVMFAYGVPEDLPRYALQRRIVGAPNRRVTGSDDAFRLAMSVGVLGTVDGFERDDEGLPQVAMRGRA
jgi:hypothetical protein